MRILVTGGAGFIGSHVAEGYVAAGHEVAVLDNFTTGFSRNVPQDVALFTTDIRDAEGVSRALSAFRPEVVNHHAGQVYVPRSVEDPAHDADVNVLGGLTLLRACVDHGVRKVIYTSSGGAIYGDPETIPCTEDHPIRPLSPYGASKYALEVYLGVFQRTFGLDFTTLRYANIYGPRQNIAVLEGRVISTFASRMLAGQPLTIDGDGEQARDMLFVSDVVGANVAALSRGSALPYHIATGVPVTVNEIYDILRDLTEYTLPVQRGPARRGDVYKIALDPTRAARDLGWRPSVQLRDGLERIVRHLREDPNEASAHQ